MPAQDYPNIETRYVGVDGLHRGRGKTSGLEVGQIRSSGAAVFRVQRGKVTSIVIHFDRDRALADLGLEA
jgi:hypothetical protein